MSIQNLVCIAFEINFIPIVFKFSYNIFHYLGIFVCFSSILLLGFMEELFHLFCLSLKLSYIFYIQITSNI